MTSGEWELRRRGRQTTKNFHTLINRINVLTRQRDSRLRGIESKINQHQEYLAKKIERGHYLQEVNYTQLRQLRELTQNRAKSNELAQSKVAREDRMPNSRLRQNVKTVRSIRVQHHKNGSGELERTYRQLRRQQQEENNRKRNMVRLRQLESKDKVERYWRQKLQMLKQTKQESMRKTLDSLNQSLGKISIMEQDEAKLLRELERTDTIRDDLELLLREERQMESSKLVNRYPRVTESSFLDHSKIKSTDKFTRLDTHLNCS